MTHPMNNALSKSDRPVELQAIGQLTPQQIEQVKKFIEQAGGADNARRVIESLEHFRPAA
ncbi:MAG TPA: hypothetical protein VHC22_12835 [Pirellulales bacterium]|nr:hypothetical protein [Pirellulales bacterium]